MNKPILSTTSPSKANTPKLSPYSPQDKKWVFSFKYWNQINNFEIGDKQCNWFISLVVRLKELSNISLEDLTNDRRLRQNIRYHAVEWKADNVPIKRDDFNWLPIEYLKNDAEYPIFQFHISQAMGRIHGFFDEFSVFNILLFDPMHNLQPSKYNNYQIRPTRLGKCSYTKLKDFTERFISSCDELSVDTKQNFLKGLNDEVAIDFSGVVIINTSQHTLDSLRDLISRGVLDCSEEALEEALRISVEQYQEISQDLK